MCWKPTLISSFKSSTNVVSMGSVVILFKFRSFRFICFSIISLSVYWHLFCNKRRNNVNGFLWSLHFIFQIFHSYTSPKIKWGYTFRSWALFKRVRCSSSACLFLPRHWFKVSVAFDKCISNFLIWSSTELQSLSLLIFLFGGRTVWTEPRKNLLNQWTLLSPKQDKKPTWDLKFTKHYYHLLFYL